MSAADAGPILALSFGLLLARGAATALTLTAAQAAILALLAAFRGFYPEAALLLLLNAAGLPWLLSGGSTAIPPRPRFGVSASLAAGAILTLLAAPVSAPLAVVLLGILVAATSRDRTIQVLGLLAMQNGIGLAGLGLGDAERIASIVPVIPVLAWAALWASRGRTA
jgi:hydrogenase-4 membrane subunit HyfE